MTPSVTLECIIAHACKLATRRRGIWCANTQQYFEYFSVKHGEKRRQSLASSRCSSLDKETQNAPSASTPGRGRSCSPSIKATLPSSTFFSDSGLGCSTRHDIRHTAHGPRERGRGFVNSFGACITEFTIPRTNKHLLDPFRDGAPHTPDRISATN